MCFASDDGQREATNNSGRRRRGTHCDYSGMAMHHWCSCRGDTAGSVSVGLSMMGDFGVSTCLPLLNLP